MGYFEETVPENEPERQFYFIDRARELVSEKSMKLGRRLSYHVTTFGCQMNAKDSEKIRGILDEIGFEEKADEDADFVLMNTCTVRENANNKVYGRLGYLHGYKKKNPDMIIAVCGCMMQEREPVERIKKSYSFVDIIFGTHNIFKLAELLVENLESGDTVTDIWDGTDKIVERLPARRKYSFKSGVNIMYGCNNFCSYCIVPYVRGRERSRRPEEILDEVRSLAGDGVCEVMLLGQNVNSYGKTLDEPVSFAELLSRVAEVEGIERVRFMTSHPKDLSDELIDVMAKHENICDHLHLPLQSGSTALLKRMNRRYTKEDYLALVDKLRNKMPDISITTDIIVGFPGETDEDFEETLDVVRRVQYDSAFTFIYSKRTGTPAAEYEDQIAPEVIKKRFDRLLEEVQTIAAGRAGRLEGRVMPVLFEEINRQDKKMVTGRLSNNSIVHVKGDATFIGSVRNVRLVESKGFYYIGEVLG